MEQYALIVKPLTQLLKKDAEQESAFDSLKKKLCSRPLLDIYNPDVQIEVHGDACQTEIAVFH